MPQFRSNNQYGIIVDGGRSYIIGKGIGYALHRRLHLRLLVLDALLGGNLLTGIASWTLLNRSGSRLLRKA